MVSIEHSEFNVPAFLAVAIGSTLAVANVYFAQYGAIDWFNWFIMAYLIIMGLALFLRRLIGSIMLALGLLALLGYKALTILPNIGNWIWNISDIACATANVLWLGTMVGAVVVQFGQFRSQRRS